MSWTITGTQRFTPNALLDQFPGATAAYSLRNLVGTSNPAVVRVRRSSDNAEQDFTAAQVTDGTLTTFCGAGDGFVRTWYDQSGNGKDVIQDTTGSQPKIVSSGSLITNNSKPAIDTDGAKTLYNAASGLNTGDALMSFAAYSTPVAAAVDTNTMFLFNIGILNVSRLFSYFSSTGAIAGEFIALDVRTVVSEAGSFKRLGSTTYRRTANTTVVESVELLTSGTKLFQNNNEIALDLASGNASTSTNITPNAVSRDPELTIGGLPQTTINNIVVSASMKVSEIVFYTTNQSSARSAITANINTHYSIY